MTAEHICIVGAGITGATIARRIADMGMTCDVFDARTHVAGNCHTVWDDKAKCYQHVYGPHIFHTNSDRVVDWVNRFARLLPYKHAVKSTVGGRVYSLPLNLHTINHFFDATFSPAQAQAHLEKIADKTVDPDANFETRGRSLMGGDLYETFFDNYTRKQWGVEPREIPSSILKRLPIRFNYDDNYFHHTIQGLPEDGYTAMIENMLDHPSISVTLKAKADFSGVRNDYSRVFWTGPIEEIFDADEGYLPYRTLDFDTRYIDGDFQGCAVMNYPSQDVEYTRITQYNYFRSSLDTSNVAKSLISYERSRDWDVGDIHYYPVHLTGGNSRIQSYQDRASKIGNLHLCGRLGRFKYIDMDVAMQDALELVDAIFGTRE